MPLATHSNDEPGNHFIVETLNREFSGKRYGVRFVDGEAYVSDPEIARDMCNCLKLFVVAPTSYLKDKDFNEAEWGGKENRMTSKEWKAESSTSMVKTEQDRLSGAGRAA